MADEETPTEQSPRRERPHRHIVAARVFVSLVATVALLLLGAAGGLLMKTPSEPSPAPAPTAVDVGFAQDMTVHHTQAVTMATLARERAADPSVRQLAFDIETNQRDQIGRMQGWLSMWGEPAQSVGEPMRWMTSGSSHGGHHQHGAHHMSSPAMAGHQGRMPGMASSDELARLRSLRGPEFDTEFLKLMLRHHEGGAPMARYGKDNASTPVVRALAGNMLGSQGTESELMRHMLTSRGAQPLPMN